LAKIIDRGGPAVTEGQERLVESFQNGAPRLDESNRYDKRKLSYATTFSNPFQSAVIRTMEWATGKMTLLRLIRQYENGGRVHGQEFWRTALRILDIPVTTPPEQLDRIPREGPVVVVANHPHGLVDGMILAELVGRVRRDYKILIRSLLTGAGEIAPFVIAVPFPHEQDARIQNLEMRRHAMEQLGKGGVVILFPSGSVAASETWLGPAVEAEWSAFTAKMVQRSGAVVVPIRFRGHNSRAYQIANRLSATLRQGLLIHEVVHARHKPQGPIVGHPILRPEIEAWADNPRGFVAWLRAHTLSLRDDRAPGVQRVGTGDSPR